MDEYVEIEDLPKKEKEAAIKTYIQGRKEAFDKYKEKFKDGVEKAKPYVEKAREWAVKAQPPKPQSPQPKYRRVRVKQRSMQQPRSDVVGDMLGGWSASNVGMVQKQSNDEFGFGSMWGNAPKPKTQAYRRSKPAAPVQNNWGIAGSSMDFGGGIGGLFGEPKASATPKPHKRAKHKASSGQNITVVVRQAAPPQHRKKRR